MNFQQLLSFEILNVGDYTLTVAELMAAILILIGTRLLYLITARIIRRRLSKKPDSDKGRLYAFLQITKYLIYVTGLLIAMQAIGIHLSVIWASAAALLVGFGLGMQQTFNDLVSGIILLLEGTVEVNDVLKVDGQVGRVTQIGIRTSKLQTQNDDFILVPNSKLVVQNVYNLSYSEEPSRFQVNVGVAYGSDVQLVTELLIKAASIHPDVVDKPAPYVHFVDFGNSSLDFVLHFFSTSYMRIPGVQSEIRYNIDQFFRETGVTIPFPQRDVWFRSQPEDPGS
jgi:small-conductance mechanosensitive channel